MKLMRIVKEEREVSLPLLTPFFFAAPFASPQELLDTPAIGEGF